MIEADRAIAGQCLDRGLPREEPGRGAASRLLRSLRHPRRQGRVRGDGQTRAWRATDRCARNADFLCAPQRYARGAGQVDRDYGGAGGATLVPAHPEEPLS